MLPVSFHVEADAGICVAAGAGTAVAGVGDVGFAVAATVGDGMLRGASVGLAAAVGVEVGSASPDRRGPFRIADASMTADPNSVSADAVMTIPAARWCWRTHVPTGCRIDLGSRGTSTL
jgi:hypothetical protein